MLGKALTARDTLRWRVQSGLIAIAIAVAIVGAVGVHGTATVVDGFRTAADELGEEALALERTRAAVLEVEAEAFEVVLLGGPSTRARLAHGLEDVGNGFQALRGLALTEEGGLVADARRAWERSEPFLVDLADGGARPTLTSLESVAADLHEAADSLGFAIERSLEDAQVELDAARSGQRRTGAVIVVAGLAVAGLLLAGHRILTRSTLQPLEELSSAATRLGSGDLRARAPVAHQRELRELAAAFNAMAAEVERTHRELDHQATHDPLTGVANRRAAEQRARRAVEAGNEHPIAVMIVDLDGFKAVNDLHGHEWGDRVLTEAARRLTSAVRAQDTVARVGGDEFLVILDGCSPTEAATSAARIVDHLSTPYAIDPHVFAVSASVGVACGTAADDHRSLRGRADQAMYEAKRAGKGRYHLHGHPETSTEPASTDGGTPEDPSAG